MGSKARKSKNPIGCLADRCKTGVPISMVWWNRVTENNLQVKLFLLVTFSVVWMLYFKFWKMLEAVTPNTGWDQNKYFFHSEGIVALQERHSDVFYSPIAVLCTLLNYVVICRGEAKVIVKCFLNTNKRNLLIFIWERFLLEKSVIFVKMIDT